MRRRLKVADEPEQDTGKSRRSGNRLVAKGRLQVAPSSLGTAGLGDPRLSQLPLALSGGHGANPARRARRHGGHSRQ